VSLSTPVVAIFVSVSLAALAASRRTVTGRGLAVALFSVYLVGVAHFVLLPLTFNPRAADEFGPIDVSRLIELRPFFLAGADVMPPWQAWLNVLVTVPFSFGLPFLDRVRGRQVLLAGVLFSVGIELAQLVADALSLALPTWSVDINDVLLNSLGVVVGFAAFRLVSAAYKSLRPAVRRGRWAHFHDTLMGARVAASDSN